MKWIRRRIMKNSGDKENSALHTDSYIESLKKHEQVAPVFKTETRIFLVF